MVRYKLFILSVFCLMFFAQSCVHGDLDDCPPMVSYAVAFKYTNHTEKTDRFYDDVKKINLYVFDDDNLIYTTKTELSPYEQNFNIPLENIPMGNYHIVAWGNLLDDEPFLITPEFEVGVTTLAEARMVLQKTAEDLNNTDLEKLFFGEMTVEIPMYISKIDTLSLTNNTNRVRVLLHWDHSVLASNEIVDHSKVVVRLKGTNAIYKFDNSSYPTAVLYAPHAIYSDTVPANGDWLKINYYDLDEFKEISRSLMYEFTVLRLYKDVPLRLVVEVWEPTSDGKHIVNSIADVDIISRNTGFEYLFIDKGIAEASWQNTFDMNELYRVDMYITQKSAYYDSFATGAIKIKDWWKVHVDDGGGAN